VATARCAVKRPLHLSAVKPALASLRLSHIAPMFNLILEGSRHRHFTRLYTRPRYMAGLGIQLFTLLLRSRIRPPNGVCYRATSKILVVDGLFAGFVILRQVSPEETEIYMCALLNEYRGKELGKWLLANALAEAPPNHRISAACLSASDSMRSVLTALGFARDGQSVSRGIQRFLLPANSRPWVRPPVEASN
jgi:GNAT superfamily N-acetyltransferase